MYVYIDQTSIVAQDANIGDGTRIWQFCNIMSGTVIGKECNIGQGVFVETGVVLGDHVKVKNNVALYNGVECEDDVFLGPNCVFTNVINPRSFIERKSEFRKTLIKRGATIGANATVICGNTVGRYAMVGAGTVVTKDVPDHALVIGNPGRIAGYVCECGQRLEKAGNTYTCASCGNRYLMHDDSLVKE